MGSTQQVGDHCALHPNTLRRQQIAACIKIDLSMRMPVASPAALFEFTQAVRV
jgi:hypothetical protein